MRRSDVSTSFPVQVYRLGGIAKLVELLRSTNQNVQRAAAGALRNLVFRNPTNKIETRRQNGIRECVSLLRRTGNTEIQKQLTGTQSSSAGVSPSTDNSSLVPPLIVPNSNVSLHPTAVSHGVSPDCNCPLGLCPSQVSLRLLGCSPAFLHPSWVSGWCLIFS